MAVARASRREVLVPSTPQIQFSEKYSQSSDAIRSQRTPKRCVVHHSSLDAHIVRSSGEIFIISWIAASLELDWSDCESLPSITFESQQRVLGIEELVFALGGAQTNANFNLCIC
jgi:hypothetical protein